MKEQNIRSMESLSLYCHVGGLTCVGLGFFVIFTDLIRGHWGHIQVGLFICAIGYALVKISSKLSGIVQDEK